MKQQFSLLSIHSNPWNKIIREKEKGLYLAKSIDQHPEFRTEITENQSVRQTKNIFNDPINLKLCQYDSNIGPKLENNKIVRRSIVGQPDIFKKKLEQIVGQDVKSNSRRSIYKGTTANTFRKNNLPQPLTGEELMAKVTQIERHLFQTRLKEDQEIMSMPFQKKQIIFKETRALEEYIKQEKAQTQMLYEATSKATKDPSKSVMIDCDRYRRRQEYCKTNDSMNRNGHDRTIKILEVDDDSGYPLFLLSEKDQVIRKPSIINHDETTQSIIKHLNDDPVYKSFSSNHYLKSQSNRYTKIAADKMTINLDNLIVQGQSKLDQEIKFDLNSKYYYQTIDKGNGDETISENYSAYYKINYK